MFEARLRICRLERFESDGREKGVTIVARVVEVVVDVVVIGVAVVVDEAMVVAMEVVGVGVGVVVAIVSVEVVLTMLARLRSNTRPSRHITPVHVHIDVLIFQFR